MEINSDDYHDYVLKDGQLIAEFEQMYSKSKHIPWHQDKQEDWLDIRITLDLLKEFAPFNYICDFGCGLGYFQNILYKNLGTDDCVLHGFDVSSTCIKQAKKTFPVDHFQQVDLTEKNCLLQRMAEDKTKRLYSLRGTLLYFPSKEAVAQAVNNISRYMKHKEYLLVSQDFPPLKNDFVGKKILPDPEAILEQFGSYFNPVKTIWLESKLSTGSDNWYIALLQRK